MNGFILMAAALLLLPVAVYADDAQAGADQVLETVPGPVCKKPIPPSSIRKADDDSDFQDKYQAYQQCIGDYASLQQKLSKKHMDAANNAIRDLNEYVNQYNESQRQK